MKILAFIFIVYLNIMGGVANAQCCPDSVIPFSTNTEQLTIWNGNQYVPFFIKGVNLGVSIPGTYPGELAATRGQYSRWFTQIKNAGFNCIRLYTLHFPRFYEVLDSFNLANPQNPLFLFQGVWLEEDLTGYSKDLFFLTNSFHNEMEEDIDCVHGNKVIPARQGKAYGTFTADVSKWNLGYIIGREVYPDEILKTDLVNAGVSSFQGTHFSIQNASPSEVWFTSSLEYLVNYEELNYSTQRPVSVSSWPTLDPISHFEEANRMEDTVNIDLSKIQLVNAPAGFFISYHAYPYYPDFVSDQSSYQTYGDNYGPNSYLGYLTDLKSHYSNFPLIIAEYGVPSSWGIAHYASSGMNHGGFDEKNQGETDIRLLKTINSANCGGGIQFSWIDEWFKRTWITDPIDYLSERRALWHNITGAEQNFGLIAFRKNAHLQNLQNFDIDSSIQNIKASADYDFLELEIGLKNPLAVPDEMWIALDTYSDSLGESILPNGDTLPHRSEFALYITNYSATLYVTQAYDLYGIWHNISTPEQVYHSTRTDGAPWKIVRWKNNSGPSDVQYIGNLQVNYSFQSPSSKDAVTIYDDKIKIRLPWSLINVVDPSQMRVFHDNKATPAKEDTISDGFDFTVDYKNKNYATSTRFTWNSWNTVNDTSIVETPKTSYWIMQDRLHEFNTNAIAVCDSFYFSGQVFPASVSAAQGVLINDFDLDGDTKVALLTEEPMHGQLNLNNDGSFDYNPDMGYNGCDTFKYCIFDGYSLSEPNKVIVCIANNTSDIANNFNSDSQKINIYPNPAKDFLIIDSENPFSEVIFFDSSGKKLNSYFPNALQTKIDVSEYVQGNYIILIKSKNGIFTKKIVISH
jgi:hypothetical protein